MAHLSPGRQTPHRGRVHQADRGQERLELVQVLRSLSSSGKGDARDGGRGGGDGGHDGGEEEGEDGGCRDQSGETGIVYGWARCSDMFANDYKGGFGGIFGDWHGLCSED